MTRSPKNYSDGSTSSTPRSTTEPSPGPKTQTTTCRGEIKCGWCGLSFETKSDLYLHTCGKRPYSEGV